MIIFNKSQNLSRGLIFVNQAFPENSQVQNTSIVATQTLDNNLTHSTFWMNIRKTNDEVEHSEVAENNLSTMEKKWSGRVVIFL